MASIAVAGFLGLLAGLVLAAQPARRVNQLFAALLLLRAGSTFAYGLLREASSAGEALAYARVGVWYTLATPVLLAALAVALFFPAFRGRGLVVGAAAVPTVALALGHAFAPGFLVAGAGSIGRGAYGMDSSPLLEVFAAVIALLDALMVVLAARACRSTRMSALSRGQAALMGLAFAFVPLRNGAYFLFLLVSSPSELAFLPRGAPILAAALVVLSLPTLLRTFEGAGRHVAAALLLLVAFLGALDAWAVLNPGGASFLPPYDTSTLLVRGAFAGAASLALLRYGLAGVPEAAVERFRLVAWGGLALAAALLCAGAVLALLGMTSAGLVAAPLLGLAVLLLSPAPLAPLASLLSRKVLLSPGDPVGEAARLQRERGGEAPSPALLGRYRLERPLGQGSSATVHLATDLLKGQQVVVKRFHAPSARQGLAEARALSAVRHPRVVPLLDVDRVGAETFLVLGHVPGGTARGLLDREGPLPPPRAVALALDVLEALEALHAQGLVHGDVKPENVLLDEKGRAVLGDLGSARFVAVDATLTGAAAGASFSTVAPEVLRGERPGPASDLYGVAASLHRLLTGRHYVELEEADAFQARERILLDPPRLPDTRVPQRVEAVLRRALAKRPAERHAGAREMADALRSASDLLVHEDRPPHGENVSWA